VSNSATPGARFREFRLLAGLDPAEAARHMGITAPSVWDIETHEGDLTACYSPHDLQRFCRVLGVRPIDVFGVEPGQLPISASEIVLMVQQYCRDHGLTIEQFEDRVGWTLRECLESPARLLEILPLDGLQNLCGVLNLDWHRALAGL
jgi:hypothetical protein